MGFAYYLTMKKAGAVKYTEGFDGILVAIVMVAVFVTGACLVVWLGNRLNEKGIGNGISIILFAGIISSGPSSILNMIKMAIDSPNPYAFVVPGLLLVFIGMIAFIIFMNNAEKNPYSICKACCWKKTVWWTKHTYSN